MDYLRNIADQLRAHWRRWTAAERVLIVGALTASLLVVAGVAVWSTRSEYVGVVDQLGPAEAAEVISALEAQQIDHRLNYAGSAVSVPKQDLARARLALKNIVGTTVGDQLDLGDSLWSDPTHSRARILRERELRLAQSISKFDSIAQATVHISQPESSPFVRDEAEAKASVILDFKPGRRFSAQDAAAVVALVSHSVESLAAQNVTVIDTDGNVYSAEQGLQSDINGQLEYRRALEADLESKAQAMLSQMLGLGRAIVRVSAAVDFTEVQREEIAYDPDGKVKVSELIRSESHTGANPSAIGVAGTGSNIGTASTAALAVDSPVTSTIEETETQYNNQESRDTIRELPGKILRLTIAAAVDLEPAEDGTAPAVTAEQVEGIIKQAVGFDTTRLDEITVVVSKLAQVLPFGTEEPSVVGFWRQYEGLIRSASLGLASLIALAIGWISIRRMRPVVVNPDPRDTFSIDSARRLAALTPEARNNPDVVAQIVAAWLDAPLDAEPDDAENAGGSRQRKAAA